MPFYHIFACIANQFLMVEVFIDIKQGCRILEWIIDQYRLKTDKRSRIVNDPNRSDQPQYIVDLIARVITVSLKTVEVVDRLPAL